MSQQPYYTSTSKDEHKTSEDRRLPPIRDLFKALEETHSTTPSYTQGYGQSYKTQPTANLPPLTSGHGQNDTGYYDSSSYNRGRSVSLTAHNSNYSGFDNRYGGPSSSSKAGERNSPYPAQNQPRFSSTHIIPEDNSIDFDPEKRYKCDYCGKRFDRPSSLQVHIRTHTGDQPYICEWPGCARTFNVKSNMLRHWRSHERSDLNSNDSPS